MHARRTAIFTMLLVALLWSMAGLVSRQFETAARFELTFWRSFFNMIGCAVLLFAFQGRAWLGELKKPLLWASGACWCVMFTAFMLALTLTTVANVLITMSLAPVFTALLSKLWLKKSLERRTQVAVMIAALGIVLMYSQDVSRLSATQGLGVLLALCIPMAAAVNWCLVDRAQSSGLQLDLIPAVFAGALLSSALTLGFALPFKASASDMLWLSVLGVFQLAVPCMLAVWCAKRLLPAEMGLLGLLEIIFGVALVWIFANEIPNNFVIVGGALVLTALAGNELVGLLQNRTKDSLNG